MQKLTEQDARKYVSDNAELLGELFLSDVLPLRPAVSEIEQELFRETYMANAWMIRVLWTNQIEQGDISECVKMHAKACGQLNALQIQFGEQLVADCNVFSIAVDIANNQLEKILPTRN